MNLALYKCFLELRQSEELLYLDSSKESNWIRDHYKKYGALPLPSTFEDEFQVTLPEYCEDWDYYKKNLIDEDFVRKATPILEEFNSKAGKVAPKEALIWLREKLASVESKQVISMGESVINTAPSRLDYFQRHSGIRYPIGIAPFDELSGGIGMDDILIFTARPGVGKSMIGVCIATAMAQQGLRVGLYSSEMSVQSVGARFDSFAGGFSNFAITRNRKMAHWEDYVDSLQYWEGDFVVLNIAHLGGEFATPEDLQAFIKAQNLDVLIIDQINGMSLSRSNGAREEWAKLAELQKQLTAMQKSLGIPFVEILQLNREAAGDNEPELHKIAGSGRFEQDASSVISIQRKSKDVLVMKVLKSRDYDGVNLKWEFTVDFDKGKILPRSDSVSAIKNAIQINQAKSDTESDEDLMN